MYNNREQLIYHTPGLRPLVHDASCMLSVHNMYAHSRPKPCTHIAFDTNGPGKEHSI